MDTNYLTNELFQKICNTILSIDKRPLIIAIDGNCSAGKTTLATLLSERLNACILHMDDFFLRPEQRTSKRYKQPGGNVDRERIKEVIKDYLENKNISYRPFNCHLNKLDPIKKITYKDILIIEGSYSMHDELIKYYDYKIFMTIDPYVQKERIKNRNGIEKLSIFINKWIPLEEQYFDKLKVINKANIILTTCLMTKFSTKI